MIRDRFRASRGNAFAICVVGTAYLVGYISTLQTKQLFAPDSRYYAGMSLWFAGSDQRDAAHQVAMYSARYGWGSPKADVLFGWGLTQPRVVYPGLSTPFVKIWGIEGLAVVPGIAMALLVLVLTVMLARQFGTLPAIATMLLVCVSPQLLFYGSAMITESLTAFWGALLLVLALRHTRRPTVGGAVAMGALTLVLGFTRQATLIPAGAFIVAWLAGAFLRRHRSNPWAVPALVVGTTAVVVQLLQMVLFPSFSQLDQFKLKTGADTLAGAISKAPELAWTIVKVDATNMAVGDRALLVLLVLALLSMVVFWRRTESHLLLGSLLAYELYNITNGTPTTFRYGMPGLVFVTFSVAMLIAAVMPRLHDVGELDQAEVPGATSSGPEWPRERGSSMEDTQTGSRFGSTPRPAPGLG